jgi:hypothetical protein
MSTTDKRMEQGMAYREAALAKGLIYDHFSSKATARDTVYNFYINMNGDMNTVSDPFLLAELILLGTQFADDEDGFGDHKILLNSYANIGEINGPKAYDSNSPRYVHWDYSFETSKPHTSLEDWLVKELNAKSKTSAQRSLRHQFMVFLSEMHEKPLGIFEKHFWWLPI